MENEIIGIEENEYGEFTTECPYCGHIVTINTDTQYGNIINDLNAGYVVEVYCDECDSSFEAQIP